MMAADLGEKMDAYFENWLTKATEDTNMTTPAEALREALTNYDARAESTGSCGDGYCVVKRPKGQHTNGGCRCSTDRSKANRMMMAGQSLANAVRAALTSPAPAGGEEGLTAALDWLKAALNCKDWHWDADQHEAATQSYHGALRELAARNSPPPSPDVAGVVERLRKFADDYVETSEIAKLMNDAATLLESLSAEKGRLERELIIAQENDKISRDFLAVCDKRCDELEKALALKEA